MAVSSNDVAILKTWFERDIQFAKWGANVEVATASGQGNKNGGLKYEYRIRFYTENNSYTIRASIDERKGDDTPHTYLGCIAWSRKPRAGEDWTRGNDLPDGPLTEETWHDILGAIVGYELVKVHYPKSPALAALEKTQDLVPETATGD